MALTKVTTAMANTATQAEQETGTSTDRFVATGRQKYHQSAAKAWCTFDGTAGSIAVALAYNVASLTDNGTGNYTMNLTTSFSSAANCSVACGNEPGGAGHTMNVTGVAGSQSTGGVNVLFKRHDNVAADANCVNIVSFGDQ